MDVTQALGTAANIMLLGMGCVFVFLGFLVIAMNLLAKFASRFEEPEVASPAPAAPAANNQVSPDVVAAISAAVHQYQSAGAGTKNKAH